MLTIYGDEKIYRARSRRRDLSAEGLPVSLGLRNKKIAAELGISIVTVQVHVRNVLMKLKVNDRTAAMNVALRRGILHL